MKDAAFAAAFRAAAKPWALERHTTTAGRPGPSLGREVPAEVGAARHDFGEGRDAGAAVGADPGPVRAARRTGQCRPQRRCR